MENNSSVQNLIENTPLLTPDKKTLLLFSNVEKVSDLIELSNSNNIDAYSNKKLSQKTISISKFILEKIKDILAINPEDIGDTNAFKLVLKLSNRLKKSHNSDDYIIGEAIEKYVHKIYGIHQKNKISCIQEENTKLKEENTKLEEESILDPLTGLLNRRGFEKELIKNIRLKNRSGTDSAILMIDIDYFKKINDTYGHDVGDKVLKGLSSIFQNTFRDYDVVSRWGGEEFIIILPGVNIDMAESRALELLQLVENTLSQKIKGINSKITVSIGISMVNKGEESGKHVLQRADVALYKAKNSGRNKVMIEVLSDINTETETV